MSIILSQQDRGPRSVELIVGVVGNLVEVQGD